MAKNPILPLYYNDLLGSTKTWTDEEFGAYVRLLIEQWDKGGLPNNYQRLTRIATSLPTNWEMIKDKFPEVDGLLKNPNMEAIREKRARFTEKQSENVRKRYQNSTKQHTKNLPLEKEIENEVENFNKNEDFETWKRWGTLIVEQSDQYWEQMKGHKVSEELMNEFLSVAVRNDWKMATQHAFRTSLLGFKSTHKTQTNGNSTSKKDQQLTSLVTGYAQRHGK